MSLILSPTQKVMVLTWDTYFEQFFGWPWVEDLFLIVCDDMFDVGLWNVLAFGLAFYP